MDIDDGGQRSSARRMLPIAGTLLRSPGLPGQPRFGVFSQIGFAPAFYALMGVMLPVMVAAMLLVTARNSFASVGFGGAQGIGDVAVAATVGGGIAGVLAGSLADKYSPRSILVIVYFAMGLSTLALWFLIHEVDPSRGAYLAVAAVDGALVAISVSALAKFQARLVGDGAKGAAESVNGIRSSVGSLIGIAVGLFVGSGAFSVLFAAALFPVVAMLILVVTKRPASSARSSVARGGSARDFFLALRRESELRDIVIADGLMYLALPSALLSMGVVAENIDRLNPILASAGIIGVLAGRLLVAARGTLGPVPRDLTFATILYALLALSSWLAIQGDWLLNQVILMTAAAAVASACGSFVQALLGAKLQERLPEDLRARGTGLIYGMRAFQLTIGVTVATWVVAGGSLHHYLVLVGIGLLVATIGLRGFRRII